MTPAKDMSGFTCACGRAQGTPQISSLASRVLRTRPGDRLQAARQSKHSYRGRVSGERQQARGRARTVKMSATSTRWLYSTWLMNLYVLLIATASWTR